MVLCVLCAVGLAVTLQKHTIVVIWTLQILSRKSRSSYCRSLTIHPPLDLPIWHSLQTLCVLIISQLHVSCPSNNCNTLCCPAPIVKLLILKFTRPSVALPSYGPVTAIALCCADNHVWHMHTTTHTHTHTHINVLHISCCLKDPVYSQLWHVSDNTAYACTKMWNLEQLWYINLD